MLIKRKKRIPSHMQNSDMMKYFYYEAPTTIRASRGSRVDYSQSANDDQSDEDTATSSDVQASTTTIRASRGSRVDYSQSANDDTDAAQDDTTAQPPAEQNATTTIRASRGGRVDYSASANDDTEEAPADNPPEANEDPAPADDSNTEDNAQSDETTAGADDIEGDDQGDNTQDDTQTDDGQTDDQGEGDVDYSQEVPQDDNADQGGDDAQADDQSGDDSAQQDDQAAGTEEQEDPDQTQAENDDGTQRRKYNLYRDYMQLYNSISSYIEKLEESRPDNIESNIVINSVLSKLHRAKDNLYEYMVVKFESASYLASLMFFQQAISVVRLCFGLIRNNKPFINQEIRIEDLESNKAKKNDK